MDEDFNLMFVDAYKRHSQLWDKNQPYFHNKRIKKVAQEELCSILKAKDSNATLQDVKKKIDALKYLFRREHAKFLDSVYKNAPIVYQPKSNLYLKLLFLCPIEERNLVMQHLEVGNEAFESSMDESSIEPKQEAVSLMPVCIVCMSNENLINIYNEPNSKMTHQMIMKEVFQIELSELSGLGYLCPPCAHKLVTAHKFKESMEETLKCLLARKEIADKLDNFDPSTVLNIVKNEPKQPVEVTAELSKSESLRQKRENEVKMKRSEMEKKKKILASIQPGINSCPVCGFKARTSHILRGHVISHFSSHVCDVCGKVVASSKSLTSHQALHASTPTGCTYCEKVFKNRSTMLQHRNYAHLQKKKVYKCKVCSLKFDTFVQRVRHERDEHNVGDQHCCRFCSKTFLVSAECTRHERNYHLKERPNTCSQCGESFWSKQTLDRHLTRVHNIGEKFSCPHCPKMFLRKYDCNVHVGTHFGSYRFNCQICDKKFNRSKDFKSHMSTHERRNQVEVGDCSEQVASAPLQALDALPAPPVLHHQSLPLMQQDNAQGMYSH